MTGKLKEHLDHLWSSNFMHPFWLISGDVKLSYDSVMCFVSRTLGTDFIDFDSTEIFTIASRDLCILNPKNEGILSIENIRKVQPFLSSTSERGKFVIVCNADLMNKSASNACLSMLENRFANSYIFLLCNSLDSLPLTVLSRCYKYRNLSSSNTLGCYDNITNDLLKNIICVAKNLNDNFEAVMYCLLSLSNKFIKFEMYTNSSISQQYIHLSNNELELYNLFCIKYTKKNRIDKLISIFQQIIKAKHDVNYIHLDKKHVLFSITSQFF